MKERIIVGMSGGVDSSVAALVLKEQGYDVVGVFMKNWDEQTEDSVCTADQDHDDVRRVCDKIGIPYFTVNFVKEYWDRVFNVFLEEYKKGRTPNPDILCNKEIKFDAFLNFAMKMQAEKLATGHYAQIEKNCDGYFLKRAVDTNKDQTYFLTAINQNQLSKAMFPIGDIEKPKLREMAIAKGLSTATKKDSTGICFIGERNFKKFLMDYLPARPGVIKSIEGEIVGKHDGLMFYTLGQRKGLGIGGKGDGNGQSWFVVEKDLKNNVLIVEQGESDKLFSNSLVTNDINFINESSYKEEFECTAKFRYRQPDQKVKVVKQDNEWKVLFNEPQRAVTPGQWVVLYKDEICLGGGQIEEVL